MNGLLSSLPPWATWDVGFVLVLALTVFVYGFTVGRDRALTVLLASYVALAVVTNTPAFVSLNQLFRIQQTPTGKLAWFLGIFLAVFLILWRSRFLKDMAMSKGEWWETFAVSLFQVGLFVSIVMLLLPPDLLERFSPWARFAFVSDAGRSFWLLLPILFFLLFGRKNHDFDFDEHGNI